MTSSLPARGLLAAALLALPVSAQQFLRDAAALSSPNTWTNGVAVADLDGDGDRDLAFANGFDYGPGGAQPQRLYLNDGAGNFTDASSQLNVADFNAQMVIADDADGDGDLDLLYSPAGAFPVTTERARILINDGSGVFTDESNARMPATTMSSWSLVAADLDDDGDRDLVINDGCLTFLGEPAQAFLFQNDGNGFYTDITATHAPIEIYNGQDMIAFDWDGDFDLDIAFSGFGTPGKRSSLWENDGTGHFTVNPVLDLLCTANTYEADWSDLDGDGDWDASVMSISGDQEGWGENLGPTTPPAETVFSGGNANDDNELLSIDFDDDGDLDVLVGTLTGAREKMYRNDGGVFVRDNVVQAINDRTLDVSFGDLDGDGRHDIVTAQGEGGLQTNKVYDNTGPVDSRPPRILQVETPSAVVAGGQRFHLMTQDAWVDDGISNTIVSATWETFLAGGASEASGGGPATFQGGAMYRVEVPTTALTDVVQVTWTVSDDVGNVADPVVVSVGDGPWTDLGSGLAGIGGVVPVATGEGTLVGGTVNRVELSSALPSSSANLVVGFSALNAAFKGGVLVPSPDLLFLGLPVTAAGEFEVPFVWPNGVPGGFELFIQFWVSDPAGPVGFSASNGLLGTTP